MDVLKLLASVEVGGCHSEIKASLCTFPYPAESQASSSFLASRGSPLLTLLCPFSDVFMPRSAYGMAEGRGSAPFCLSSHLRLTSRCCWGGLPPPWLPPGLPPSLPAWVANGTGKEAPCREQEGGRKRNAPVSVRSQNGSVPPLVPRLSGINAKASWLLGWALSVHIYQEEALALPCFQLLAPYPPSRSPRPPTENTSFVNQRSTLHTRGTLRS